MKTRLIIMQLGQSKDFNEYLDFRVTVNDDFITMVRDIIGGMYWDMIKEYESEYQEFLEWFKQRKLI